MNALLSTICSALFACAAIAAPPINATRANEKESVSITLNISIVPTTANYTGTATAIGEVVLVNSHGAQTNPPGTRISWRLDPNLSTSGASATMSGPTSLTNVLSNWTIPGNYALVGDAKVNKYRARAARAIVFPVVVTDNNPPTVSITAPAGGASYTAGDNVTITANAEDGDGTIGRVEFYVDGVLVGTDTGSPYSASFVITGGPHVLTAIAQDNFGSRTVSAGVTVSAITPQQPNVTFIAPTNGVTLVTPTSLTLTVSAGDPQGALAGVHFLTNGVPIVFDSTAPFSVNLGSLGVGTLNVSAIASNTYALTRTASVSVSVVAPVNVPPVVTLTSPTNGTAYTTGNNVALTATATDGDGTIAIVEWLDGTTVIASDASFPYTNVLSGLTLGTHVITARATDNSGAVVVSLPATITASVPPVPPSITITSPANGQAFVAGANVTFSAQASDPQNALTSVKFYRNSTLLNTFSAGPFTMTLANMPIGTWVLTAVATNAFNLGRADSVTISVNAPTNNPPTISITSPAGGTQYTNGNAVVVSATAADPDGTVTNVRFYLDGVQFGSDTTLPYAATISAISAGVHTLMAVATDNSGAQTASATVTITAVVPPAPPSITITAPSNGQSFTTPVNVSHTAQASDPQGALTGVGFWLNGSSVANFGATGPYSLTATGAAVGVYNFVAVATNSYGLRTTNSVTYSVNAPANVHPVVAITSPADGAAFTAGASVTITATATDADGTITSVVFKVDGTTIGTDTSSPYSASFTIAAGIHSLTATATDNAGAQTVSASVSVGASVPILPPNVSFTSPANGASFTAPANVSLAANASDPQNALVAVSFYTNNVLVKQILAPGPYTYVLTNTLPGTFSALAIATNNFGLGATDSRTFTVQQPVVTNVPPSVTLTAPANNAVFHTGDNITATATATDPDGSIAQVAFYRDATVFGTDVTSGYSAVLANQGWGQFNIVARATDNQGATTTSATSHIIVQPDAVLSWDPVTLGAQFDYLASWTLYRSVNGAAYAAIATNTVPSYTNGPLASANYSWYVKARNTKGESLQSNAFALSVP